MTPDERSFFSLFEAGGGGKPRASASGQRFQFSIVIEAGPDRRPAEARGIQKSDFVPTRVNRTPDSKGFGADSNNGRAD